MQHTRIRQAISASAGSKGAGARRLIGTMMWVVATQAVDPVSKLSSPMLRCAHPQGLEGGG
jgi:hypothetical protein